MVISGGVDNLQEVSFMTQYALKSPIGAGFEAPPPKTFRAKVLNLVRRAQAVRESRK
jgi:hypothetical protein